MAITVTMPNTIVMGITFPITITGDSTNLQDITIRGKHDATTFSETFFYLAANEVKVVYACISAPSDTVKFFYHGGVTSVAINPITRDEYEIGQPANVIVVSVPGAPNFGASNMMRYSKKFSSPGIVRIMRQGNLFE
jgi:hypothetical protein